MNEYIKHIKDDKYRIAEEKRAAFKKADGVSGYRVSTVLKHSANKEDGDYGGLGNVMQVEAVINTTGLFDSHEDVHIPGLWVIRFLDQVFYIYYKSMNGNLTMLFLTKSRLLW